MPMNKSSMWQRYTFSAKNNVKTILCNQFKELLLSNQIHNMSLKQKYTLLYICNVLQYIKFAP